MAWKADSQLPIMMSLTVSICLGRVMTVSRPTEEGKSVLAQLVEDSRDRAKLTDWTDYAALITGYTGIRTTKDALYKIAVKNYQVEPPWRALYALVRVNHPEVGPLLRLRDKAETPVTMDMVGDILYGFMGIDGEKSNPANAIEHSS